jgi:hypothetical protein
MADLVHAARTPLAGLKTKILSYVFARLEATHATPQLTNSTHDKHTSSGFHNIGKVIPF